jgi:hypothetical protein
VGRGVRWTFEVSADVDPKSDRRPPKTARKRQPAKSIVKGAKPLARRRAQSPVRDAPAPVTSSVEPTGRVPVATVATAPVEIAPEPIAPVSAAPAVSQPSAVQAAPRLQWVALGAAAVIVVAAMAFPRGPAAPDLPAAEGSSAAVPPTGSSAKAPQAIAPSSVPAAAASAAPTAAIVTPEPVSEPAKKPSVTAVARRSAASAKSPAPVVAPVEPPKKEEPVATAVVVPPPPPVTEATAIVAPGLVTITGCLEISTDGDTFRLTDAEGADVPKSRSWRSGFFKKRPAPVMLVEPLDHVALKTSVGKRVSATGQLANRDLRVNSLHVVGPPCN